MRHEGNYRLDDVRHRQEELHCVRRLGPDGLAKATTLDAWLRRVSSQPQIHM